MNLSLLHDREGFRFHVIEALAQEPVDYLTQFEFIDKQRESRMTWAGEGFSCRSISVKTKTQKGILLAITSFSSVNDPRMSSSPATFVLRAVESIRY